MKTQDHLSSGTKKYIFKICEMVQHIAVQLRKDAWYNCVLIEDHCLGDYQTNKASSNFSSITWSVSHR